MPGESLWFGWGGLFRLSIPSDLSSNEAARRAVLSVSPGRGVTVSHRRWITANDAREQSNDNAKAHETLLKPQPPFHYGPPYLFRHRPFPPDRVQRWTVARPVFSRTPD